MSLVGYVQDQKATATHVAYSLEDSTGEVIAQAFTSDSPDLEEHKFDDLRGSYVKVVGRVQSTESGPFAPAEAKIQTLSIRPLTDHNEITYHSLAAIQAFLRATLGKREARPEELKVRKSNSRRAEEKRLLEGWRLICAALLAVLLPRRRCPLIPTPQVRALLHPQLPPPRRCTQRLATIRRSGALPRPTRSRTRVTLVQPISRSKRRAKAECWRCTTRFRSQRARALNECGSDSSGSLLMPPCLVVLCACSHPGNVSELGVPIAEIQARLQMPKDEFE